MKFIVSGIIAAALLCAPLPVYAADEGHRPHAGGSRISRTFPPDTFFNLLSGIAKVRAMPTVIKNTTKNPRNIKAHRAIDKPKR